MRDFLYLIWIIEGKKMVIPYAHPNVLTYILSQMWVLREGWAENTDTHWVCRSSVASLL